MYHSFQMPLVTLCACYMVAGVLESFGFLPIFVPLAACGPPFALCLGAGLLKLLILSASAPVPGAWSHVSPQACAPLEFRPVGCPGALALWRVQESSWTHCRVAFFLVSLEWCFFQPSLSTNQSTLILNEFGSWISVSPSGAATLEVEQSMFPQVPQLLLEAGMGICSWWRGFISSLLLAFPYELLKFPFLF